MIRFGDGRTESVVSPLRSDERRRGHRLPLHSGLVSFVDDVVNVLPKPMREIAYRHRELIKFAVVGATTFIIDSGIFYVLKWTVLETKPVTAKIISGVIAVICSYILNREWSFKNRGGREKHHEALLFFGVSGVGVVLSFIPLWISSYVFDLRQPDVSFTVENIADFISAFIIGNLLQMAFRFWAMRRWVFPDEISELVEEIEELLEEEQLGRS
jgi:putative flippase GtrA